MTTAAASACSLRSLSTGVDWVATGGGVVTLGINRTVWVYKRDSTELVEVFTSSAMTSQMTQPLTTNGSTGAIPGYVESGQSIDFFDSAADETFQAEALATQDIIGADGMIGSGNFELNLDGTPVTTPPYSDNSAAVTNTEWVNNRIQTLIASALGTTTTQPTVTAVSPASGTTGGGAQVQIAGTGFIGATAVKFGSVNATTFTVIDSMHILAVAPAEVAATVDIEVTGAAGLISAAVTADHFQYAAPTGPTVVQSAINSTNVSTGSGVTSVAKAFTNAVTAGNLMVGITHYFTGANSVGGTWSDSQTKTNPWVQIPGASGYFNSTNVEIWCAPIQTSDVGSARTTVTFTPPTGGAGYIETIICELSGVDTWDQIAIGTASNATSGATAAATTTAPNEIALVMGVNPAGSIVVGSGFTQVQNTGQFMLESKSVAAEGSITGAATGASGNWQMLMVTFKAGAATSSGGLSLLTTGSLIQMQQNGANITGGLPTVTVWGAPDHVSSYGGTTGIAGTGFASQQYQNRVAICQEIASLGFKVIRFRVLAADAVLGIAGPTGMAFQDYVGVVCQGWRNAAAAVGLYIMFTDWDPQDGGASVEGVNMASQYNRSAGPFQLFTALVQQFGASDPWVLYNPFNEPYNLSQAQWYTIMAGTWALFRTTLGYHGTLGADPNGYANSGPSGAGFVDTGANSFTALESYDAGLLGVSQHQTWFSDHQYNSDGWNGTFTPSTWFTSSGLASGLHAIWATEIGNYNGSTSTESSAWDSEILAYIFTLNTTHKNFIGPGVFLWGNWADDNRMTTGPYSGFTAWGGQIVSALGGGATSGTPTPAGVGGSWSIVVDEEFTGTSLDSSFGSHTGWTNQNGVTDQSYNVVVNNGLALLLSDANDGAAIESVAAPVAVGYFVEARVFLSGSGNVADGWCAFWLAGPTGEIDIIEVLGGTPSVNYHDYVAGNTQQGPFYPSGSWANGWHTFGVYRGATSLDYYWDGVKVKSFTPDTRDTANMYLIYTMGNDFTGNAVTGVTGEMKSSYCRVFQSA